MADPTKYVRDYGFANYQANRPDRPLPGTEVDVELDNIADVIGGAVDAIKDIRRADGALKNGIVTADSLDQSAIAALGPNGALILEAVADAEAQVVAAATQAGAAAGSATAAAGSATAAAGSATAAAGSATAAAGSATAAAADRVQTGLDRTAAETARIGAETARDAAFLTADVYPDIATGRAAVADDEQFTVVEAGATEAVRYVRDSSSTQTEVARYPTAAAADALQQAPSLEVVQPNLISTRADRLESTADFATLGTSTLTTATVNGLPVWRLTVPGSNAALYRVSRALIVGSIVSASVKIEAMSAAGAGASSTVSRVLLRQLNTGGTEISGTRQTYDLVSPTSAALPAPVRVRFPSVAIHADCDRVELWIEASNTGGATSRTIDFREMHISAGPSTTYRVPGGAFAVDATTQIQRRADWAWTPNDYPDPTLITAGASAPWTGGALSIVTTNGRRCLRSPSSASAISRVSPTINVSGYVSGRISASAVIEGKGVTAAAALRLGLRARDGSNNLLTWPDRTATDLPSQADVYTRYVPTAAITSPTTLVIAADAQLPAGAVTVEVFLRVETTEQMDFTKITVREGGDPAFKDVAGAALTTSYATVGASAQFATIDAALDALGGSGEIYLVDAAYTSTQRITPSKVAGSVTIIGQTDATARTPTIRMASKLTGITKTSGRTKIYQATVSGLPASIADWQWCYQEGVADPRTLIGSDRRFPQHQGRTNRLMDFAKLIKPTDVSSLSAALTEMDAAGANEPMSYADQSTNTLYFTIVGGGDGSAADIYVDASVGLVSAATERTAGVLTLQNVEVRYGGVDVRPFRRAEVRGRVTVQGARTNCVDYCDLTIAGIFEASCAGSRNNLVGDGLNAFGTATLIAGGSGYLHDCNDDGESGHIGATVRMGAGWLVEYNGGAGVAPALGADAIYSAMSSHKNQRKPGRKGAAFNVIGSPSGTSRIETRAEFVDCVDYESDTSFGSTSDADAVGRAINCRSIGAVTRGFQRLELIDCRGTGNGTVTADCTTVTTTAV